MVLGSIENIVEKNVGYHTLVYFLPTSAKNISVEFDKRVEITSFHVLPLDFVFAVYGSLVSSKSIPTVMIRGFTFWLNPCGHLGDRNNQLHVRKGKFSL